MEYHQGSRGLPAKTLKWNASAMFRSSAIWKARRKLPSRVSLLRTRKPATKRLPKRNSTFQLLEKGAGLRRLFFLSRIVLFLSPYDR